RRCDLELEAPFQVRLIEAGESHARVHRDEKRIEIFAAVVVIFKAGDGLAGGSDIRGEFDIDNVTARVERGGGQHDVAVIDDRREGRVVEGERGELTVAEVEQERGLGARFVEVEPYLLGSFRRGR